MTGYWIMTRGERWCGDDQGVAECVITVSWLQCLLSSSLLALDPGQYDVTGFPLSVSDMTVRRKHVPDLSPPPPPLHHSVPPHPGQAGQDQGLPGEQGAGGEGELRVSVPGVQRAEV